MDTKIIFENNELIMMGFNKINIVNPNFLYVDFKGFSLKIFGNNLGINYYSKRELSLKGNIQRIENTYEL